MANASDQQNTLRVSVIIPVYNAENYLEACLGSLAAQPVDAAEFLFIDDASTDASCALIEAHAAKDDRIRLFRLPQNAGAPTARNLGIDNSRGHYLLFMDADDELVSGALPGVLDVAQANRSDAVKGCMLVSEGSGNLRPHHLNQTREQRNTTLTGCPEIQHMYQYQSYLLRTELVRSNDITFDTSLRNFQDPVFMSRLLPLCRRIDVIMDPLYIRKVVPGSIITSNWGFDNFRSLIEGVGKSYDYLAATGNTAAAGNIAMSFCDWWHKMLSMPARLDEQQCQELFRMIAAFARRSEHAIARPGWGAMMAYAVLSDIARERYATAYRELLRASSASNQPAPLIRNTSDFLLYLASRIKAV